MRTFTHRTLTVLGAACLAVAVLLYPEVRAAELAERPTLDTDTITLAIETEKPEYKVGEAPKILATFTNHTKDDIMLVRPLDGSDFGRAPAFTYEVERPKDAGPVQLIGRCGNTNPITTDAFFTVPAGESVVLDAYWMPPMTQDPNRAAGTYTVQAKYSTAFDEVERWVGGPLGGKAFEEKVDEITPFLSRVPSITLESNALAIQFVANPELDAP